MNGCILALFLVSVAVMGIMQVHCRATYTHQGLHDKVVSLCCAGGVGLRTECCQAAGCSNEEVIETTLREECIDEGCSNEEILESCT